MTSQKPEKDDTVPVEPVTLKDIADNLRETGAKLRNAVLFPLWMMAKTYMEGTSGAVDGLADGLKGKKPVEAKPEPKPTVTVEATPVVTAPAPPAVPPAPQPVVTVEAPPVAPVAPPEVKPEPPAQGNPPGVPEYREL